MRSSLIGAARKRVPFGLLLCLLLVCASPLSAQVTLDLVTSPASAQPGVQILTLNGDGFPTDPIHPSDVTMILTPVPGGAVVRTTPLLVTQISGSSARIRFTVPSSLTVNAPTVYNVSLTGTTLAGTPFSSKNSAQLTVNPASSIILTPNNGVSGSSVIVNIVGNLTDFVQGGTFASFGPGVAVGTGAFGDYGLLTVTGSTAAKAVIQIDPTAAPGGRTVVVSTGAQTASASFLISAPHQPPVADAGPQQLVNIGSVVQLDGSRSTSPSGSPLTFSWSLTSVPANSSARLSEPTLVNPTFAADVAGQYTAQLTVSDGVATTSASVTITTRNTAPVANAGTDQTVAAGSVVHLDGSGSTDADGDSLTYSWVITSKPTGSNAALSNASSITPTFVADAAGTYTIQLSVNDGHSHTATASVNVSTLNQAPIANAGANQTTPIGIPVQLDGTGSTDPDGDTLTYLWTFTYRPTGSNATLSGVTTATPSLTPDVAGNYVIQLRVDDGHSHTATATVSVSTSNSAPIADAGPAQTVAAGATVFLDGSASHDPDGTSLTYLWSFTSKPSGSTAGLNSTTYATPQFVADLAGQYVAQLIVSDGSLQSTPATVLITVTAPDAKVNPQLLDFGSQTVSVTSGSKGVLVTNTGTAPLSLNGISIVGADAGQFQFTAPAMPTTIAPGDSASVNVTFTPTAPGSRAAALVIPQNASGGSQVSLVGLGVSAPVLTYFPGAINFGDQPLGVKSAATPITVSNAGDSVLVISGLTLTGAAPGDYAASSGVLPVNVPPNGSTTINVTFTPTAAGSRGAVLQIADNADGSPHIISLSGNGVAAAINFLPSALTFANQAINSTSSPQPVTVSNTGTAPLIISAATITGTNSTEFAVTNPPLPLTIAAGSSASFSVTFTPSGPSIRTASLTITDNAPGSPHQVPLSGTGVTSALIVSAPPSVNFGNAPVSSTINNSIVLSNPGTGDLVITTFTINGINPGDFVAPTTALPLTIPAGGNSTVQVGFAPTVIGSRSATLDVGSNAKTGTLHIGLSGNGTAPALTITSSVAFGNQLIHVASAAKVVTLTNGGSASVTINTVALSGTAAADFAFTAPATPFTIAAGASVNVNVTFTPSATGARAASLTFTDTAPGSPHSTSLSGTGTAPDISISPSSVPFGNQRVATPSPASTITITNPGSANLVISAVSISGPNAADFALAPVSLPLTLTPNTSATLSVTFTPAAAGARSATITLTHNANAGSDTIALSGTGTIGATTISINPTTLDLGSSPVGTATASKNVSLSNTGNANLVISSIAVSGPNAADFTFTGPALPQSVSPGGFSFATITLNPSAVGTRTATLTITSNAAGSPHTVSLTGSGAGTPIIALSPQPSLDFGNQNLNTTSAPFSVTISNTGTDNLVISSLSVTGTNASEFTFTPPTLPLTIAAGANVTVPVKFTPINSGARSASFRVADNSAGSPHLLPLTGTGTIASLGIAPPSVTFGSRPIGTTSSPTVVTLTNTGNGVLTISAIAVTGAQAGDFALTGLPALPATLQSNASATFSVTFTPTGTGPRSASVSITDNGTGNPHSVPLAGTATAAGPGIDIAPASIPFGNQLVGTTSANSQVTISNPGNQNLTITSIALGGANPGDYHLTNAAVPITVAPNTNTVVQVSFSPQGAGSRPATVIITDNAPGSPHTVALTGTGTAPQISVTPPNLDFGTQPVGSPTAPSTLTITNLGTAPLTISTLQISGANAASFSLNTPPTLPVTVPPAGMVLVRVVFTPAAQGANAATLTITHNASGNPTTVALTGTGANSGAGISISPAGGTLSFGSVNVGTTSASKPIILSNTGNGNLVITALAVSGANASEFVVTSGNLPITIGPSSSVVLSTTFTPAGGGTRTATLKITDNATGSPQSMILTGTGVIVGPAISLSPSPVVFANQLYNTTSAAIPVTISNPGTTNLVISSLTKSGPNAAEFSFGSPALPITVAAGGTATLNLTFTPNSAGSKSATISFADNAPATPQTLSLSGTGTSPVIAINPPSLAFGDQQALATSAPLPIAISNTGNGNLIITALSASPAQFQFTSAALPITVPPGGNTTVNVTFTPAQMGQISGNLNITSNAPGSPHSAGLTGNGTSAAITFSPSPLTFGSQLINTTSAASSVTITNSGTISLTITALTVTGANASDFALTAPQLPITVLPNASTSVSFTFKPTAAGARTANFSVTDNAPGSPHLLTLNGTGTAPVVTFTPPTFAFPDQQVTTTSAATTIQVGNSGNGNLIISAISLGGANSGDFAITNGTLPITVAPGASTPVSVMFTPSAVGARSATLVIASNASTSPNSMNLTGNGTPIPILNFPATVTFAPQLINTSSTPKTITLGNTGAAPVIISSFSITGTNAGDFSLVSGTLPITITNGSTATISVTFTPPALGSRSASLAITTNTPSSPQIINLTGTGLGAPTLQLGATTVSFGNQFLATTSSPQQLSITNSGSADLIISNMALGGINPGDYAITAGPFPLTITAGNSISVPITFTPGGLTTRSATLTITHNATGSPTPVTLTGVGVAPSVKLSTTSLTFGSQNVGATSAPQGVTVTNQGTANLVITSLSFTGAQAAEFAVAPAPPASFPITVTPNGSIVLNVTFAPASSGPRAATLNIADNASGSPQQVSVSGTGTAPAVTFTPPSVDFGTVLVNTSSSPSFVTVSNTGNGPLVISAVNMTGAQPGDFQVANPALPITVVAGSATTFTVTFKPTAGGTRAATLSLTTNAPNTPNTVPLTGNGNTVPAISVAPPSLTFASQLVNTSSAPLPIVISNPGSANLVITSAATIGPQAAEFVPTLATSSGTRPLSAGAGTLPLTIAPGATATINMVFTPTALGSRTATLVLTSNAPTSPTNINLSGPSFGVPVLSAPSSLPFGNQLLGTSSAPTPLTLTNTGTDNLIISAVAVTGTNPGDFVLAPISPPVIVGPGKTSVLTLTFTPAALGARAATLRITDNASDSPQSISLTGAGTKPAISVAPPSIDFGQQTLGVASPGQPLTVSNPGTADLVVSGVTLTGANPTDFSITGVTFPFTVTAGGTPKVINVVFTPGAVTARSANLLLSHNAPGSVTTVPLTGTGVQPIMTLTPATTLNFTGQVVNTTSAQSPIRIDNTGNGPLVITDLKLEGAFPTEFAFTASTLPITVAPGASTTIQVTFTPSTTGSRSATLHITDNAPGNPHFVGLIGTGTQATFSPDVTSLAFGNQLVPTASTPKAITIRNTGTAPLNISAIAVTGANASEFTFTGATLPIAVPPGNNTVINVTFTPTASGARTANLVVTHDAPTSPTTFPLTGTGTVPQIGLSPTTISYPNQLTNTASAAIPVVVTNTGLGNLIITAISFTGTNPGDFSFATGTLPITVPPSGSPVVINVTFKPTGTGFRSATLSLTDNSSGSPHTVAVSGTGVEPIYSASTASLTFPDQLAGTPSAPMNVTISNIGTGNLIISGITFSGTNATDFTTGTLTFPITVLPNANTVIPVIFTPVAGGARSATLSITDNATGSPHTVTLAGNGTAPIITVTPSTLNFGSQQFGTSSGLLPISISNTGNGDLIITAIQTSGTNSTDFSFTSGTLPIHVPPNGNTGVNVTFTPRGVGNRIGFITFTDNAAGSPQPVALNGTGTGPTADLNNTSLAFGNVTTNTNSAVQGVTITNNGNAALVVTSITLTGANPGDFLLAGANPFTLVPGASKTISALFHPHTGGPKAANISIVDNAPDSPQLVTMTGTGTGIGTLSMNTLTVGKNLESIATVSLSIPPANDIPVIVTSSDSNLVIFSNDSTGTTQGFGSITVTIPAGQTSAFPGFYVQGLASAGSVSVKLDATAAQIPAVQFGTVNLSPSGFILSSPAGTGLDFNTVVGAVDSVLTVNPVRLDSSNVVQSGAGKIRGGFSIDVPLSSADTNVGTIIENPTGTVTMANGATSGSAAFHALNPGNTLLNISAPIGFNNPTAGAQLHAIVAAPQINLNPINVGVNLQVRGVGTLDAPAPNGGVQVTITSLNPSVVTLSPDQSSTGQPSIILTVPAGQTALPNFFVYGMQTVANAQLTASATGYGFTPGGQSFNGSVAVTPSGFVIAGPSGTPGQGFNTTTISGNTRLTVTVKRFDPNNNPVSDGQIRGGITVNVPVISSAPLIGSIVNSPAVLQSGGTSTNGVLFQPNQTGSATLSLGTPNVAGFSTANSGATVVATVLQPSITFSFPTHNIGSNLQLDGSAQLSAQAPNPNLVVTITSSNPSAVVLSNDPTMQGTGSIPVTVLGGNGLGGVGFPTFYVQAIGAPGSTSVLTASANGFSTATTTVTVTPAGFVLISPNGLGQDFAALTIQGNPTLTVSSVQLSSTFQPQATQSVRGGLSPAVVVNSQTTSVGTIDDSPALFTGGISSDTVTMTIHGVGQTLLSIPAPAGYSTPALGASLTANVH